MIIYVNGSTHTMAAEAVTPFIVAKDDPEVTQLGSIPHPDNLAVSWSKVLSLSLRAGLQCSAVGDNTIDRIIDDTRKWTKNQRTGNIIIIEWADINADDEEKIWQLHQELNQQQFKHIFFNGNTECTNSSHDWGSSYITPFDVNGTYERRMQIANFETVTPTSKHFGRDGHAFWSRFLINYIISQKLV